MTAPDAKEIELLSQLRTRITDLKLEGDLNTDHDLVRWIRARDGNLDQAESMLRDSTKWRIDNDIDNILSWTPPEKFLKECPLDFVGYDNENAPVIVCPFGKWDLKKIVELGEKETFVKFCDQLFEFLRSKMKGKLTPSGYPVTQFVYIVDMGGLAYKTLASIGAVDMTLQAVRRFEANQPETAKAFYVINAGMVFAALFALMKPLLSARTMGKMTIMTDKSKWKPVLLANIPASILPPSLGGTNDQTVTDEILAEAAAAPEEEELPAEFLEVTIPAGDKLVFAFAVDEGNSTISWSFKTDKYDIAFGVNCDGKAYIEKDRVNSHEEVQEGKIVCETPGDYIFTFDNYYSRLRTKALSYRIDVRGPSGRKHIGFI